MSDCFTETRDIKLYTALPNKLPLDQVDQCPEDLFNRILWHAMKGSSAPYPAWAVRLVEDDD